MRKLCELLPLAFAALLLVCDGSIVFNFDLNPLTGPNGTSVHGRNLLSPPVSKQYTGTTLAFSRLSESRKGSFACLISGLPDGLYIVSVRFEETELCSRGARVFDVFAQSHPHIRNLDVFHEAKNRCFSPVSRSLSVLVGEKGFIRLEFRNEDGKGLPKISSVSGKLIQGVALSTVLSNYKGVSRKWKRETGLLTFPDYWRRPVETMKTMASCVLSFYSKTNFLPTLAFDTGNTMREIARDAETTTTVAAVSGTTPLFETVSVPSMATGVTGTGPQNVSPTTESEEIMKSFAAVRTSTVNQLGTSAVVSSSYVPLEEDNSAFQGQILGQSFINVDFGSSSDPDDLCTGPGQPLKYSASRSDRMLMNLESQISTHRYGIFSCKFTGLNEGMHSLVLGFGEVFKPNCKVGARIFSVYANENILLRSFDVYQESGLLCGKSVYKVFRVMVFNDGILRVSFQRDDGTEKPMISSLSLTPIENAGGFLLPVPLTEIPTTTNSELTTARPVSSVSDQTSALQTSSSSSATESLASSGYLTSTTSTVKSDLRTEVFVNFGSSAGIDGVVRCPAGCKNSEASSDIILASQNREYYASNTAGSSLFYEADMKPGVYDISLGFAETDPAYCSRGARVFSVFINDIKSEILQSIDVYRDADGCYKPLSHELQVEVLSSVKIEFTSVKNDAFVSWIRISPASGCVLTPGGNVGLDHRAHAVPGTYPQQIDARSPKAYIDIDGNGYEMVLIDGFGSHTHYQDLSDPRNPVPGYITEYKWTNLDTGEILSREQSFWKSFPLGTTTLLLEVRDSTCDRHESETTVTVAGSVSAGAYSYYYKTELGLNGVGIETDTALKPFYAEERIKSFSGWLDEPTGLEENYHAVRYIFFYEVSEASEATRLQVSTEGTGSAEVYKGRSLVVDTEFTPFSDIPLAVGLVSFEMIYRKKNANGRSFIKLSLNGTDIPVGKMSYDRRTVVPVLSSITPNGSSVDGGVEVTVSGYGFFSLPYLYFGSTEYVRAQEKSFTSNSFSAITPRMPEGAVKIHARTSENAVESNSISFHFGDVSPPVVFTRAQVTDLDGSKTNNKLGACINVWGDYYFVGTLGGFVTRYEVDENYVVQRSCSSDILTSGTFKSPFGSPAAVSIFGITFDPTDVEGKPYVSVQTTYWFYYNQIEKSNEAAWRNGRIERLRPTGGTTGRCLQRDALIVTGLPVSDHDHGVNGMDFDQNGDLYVSVGGATNGGLPHRTFGNMWETPLSAAILRVKLSLGSRFDGRIRYSEEYDRHKFAKQISGDVEPYATGLRNSFDVVFTSKKEIYATDNGGNVGYGNFALDCSDNSSLAGSPPVYIPDKILKIVQGGYYGHPNINRGECQFINPVTDMDTGSPQRDPLPKLNYVPDLMTVLPSCNGIIEYTASHFGSALKGELLVTNFAAKERGLVQRIRSSRRLVLDESWGGLALAQGIWGDLIFSRVGTRKDFHVLVPKYPIPTGLSARVVTPFRGGSAGGLSLTITGHGFGNGNPEVEINGTPCPVVQGSVKETTRGSILKCISPANKLGGEVVDVVVTEGTQSSKITGGFMYSRK